MLGELLGQGGQGAVYRVSRQPVSSPGSGPQSTPAAFDCYVPRPERTPDQAAVKLFVPDPKHPSLTERFIAEYRVAARLKDGSFVRAYEMFEHKGLLCYTMDLLPGGSLSQVMGHALPPAVAVGLILDVLEGLDLLHGRGIVHRDIKHANVLLSASLPVESPRDVDKAAGGTAGADGLTSTAGVGATRDTVPEEAEPTEDTSPSLASDKPLVDVALSGQPAALLPMRSGQTTDASWALPRALISDFGISDVQDMFFGERGFYSFTGTFLFMAPEMRLRDRVDARVDLFAAGVLLYMLLSGRHPAGRDQKADSLRTRMASPEWQPLPIQEMAPHVPAEVAEIVMQLLAVNPEHRIRTAALAFDRLHAWFVASAHAHRVKLSHQHHLGGRPYLAASMFCGRARELEQARMLLERNQQDSVAEAAGVTAAESEPGELPPERIPASVVVLSGEAGVGKSRLTSRIRKRAEGLGYQTYVLQGRRGQGAYLDLQDLKQYLEAACEPMYAELRPQGSPAESESRDMCWVPDLNRDPAYALLLQKELPPAERGRFEELHERYQIERFCALLRLYSYSTPLCVVIEDAQWLDPATLKHVFTAVRFLATSKSRGHPCQVTWLLNHRLKDLEGDSLDALLAQLDRVRLWERAPICLELPLFSAGEATELAAGMLQLAPSDPQLCLFVQRMSVKRELTPLFVEQALWSLFSQGVLEVRDPAVQGAGPPGRWLGAWNLDTAILDTASLPLSVREAIGSRASRLNAETLRIMGVAAVSGNEFDVEVVARATGAEAGSVLAACEQACREGFVVQERGERRVYLADSGQSEVRYRFSHDRYREAILEGLEAEVRRQIHSALAQSIRIRWGETEQSAPLLAEHHHGAGEHGQAHRYALQVAERAHAEGQHERAAQYYELALESRRQDAAHPELTSLPAGVRDRAAQSLHSIGKLHEGSAQLEALLTYPDLPELLRLDCQRRLAEVYFQQQNYKQAVTPMLQSLAQMGVRLPSGMRETLGVVLRGLAAVLVMTPTGWLMNMRPAKDPEREALIMQTLINLAECSYNLGSALLLRVVCYSAIRLVNQGLHDYSVSWCGFFVMLISALGLTRLSRRLDERISGVFPESELSAVGSLSEQRRRIPDVRKRAYHLNAGLRTLAHVARGDAFGAGAARIASRIRESLLFNEATTDLRRRWTTPYVIAVIGLFTGRISVFRLTMGLTLDCTRSFNQPVMEEALGNMSQAIEHFLAGRHAQAQAAFRRCQGVAEKWGDQMLAITSQGLSLLCEALAESGAQPAADLLERTLAAARRYLDIKYISPIVWGQSATLTAAALALHRQGARHVPRELRVLMRRGWMQCQRESQQRGMYRAAQATLAAVQGQHRRSVALFAEAAESAVGSGLLYHLLWILRVAVRVLPAGSRESACYQAWQAKLQANLDQPPVTLGELEAGRMPPPPDSGRPAGMGRG